MMLFIDLETRSQCDLLFHGLRRYAEDTTTEVICMAYAFGDDDVKFWWADEPFPSEVKDYFRSGGPVCAHNAEFERHLFDFVIGPDYDFDPPKLEQWRCSAIQALVCGYPASLDAAARAVGVQYQKQAQGTRLIGTYCKPGFKAEFEEGDAELMQEYCEFDVLVMREIVKCFRDLTDYEWAEYHLTCRINDRGLPMDVPFCTAALSYAREIAEDANREIALLTDGMMTKHTQRKGRDAWLLPRLTEDQQGLLTVYKKGEKKMSLDADHRGYLLACEDLDQGARELLEQIDNGGSAALKKYAVAVHQHVDGRLHNAFLFHGAQTGRFCVDGDTSLTSVNCTVKIKNAPIGLPVLTHEGRYAPITSRFFKGYEAMYRVSFTNGSEVVCTANHELLTERGWKSVRKLEGFKRPGAGGACDRVLSVGRAPDYKTNNGGVWCDTPYGVRDLESEFIERANRPEETGELLAVEVRGEEPTVWVATREGEQARELYLNLGAGEPGVFGATSQDRHGRTGSNRASGRMASAPHRQQPGKQRPGQPMPRHGFRASEITPTEIRKVEVVGERGVWDITVAGDHSYVAGGLIHHNSGRGFQPHNIRRDAYGANEAESLIQDVLEGYQIKQPATTMARLLRSSITSDEGVYYCDWSAIEGRAAPWLSDTRSGEQKLDLYRTDQDVYVHTAAGMFHVPLDQVGKDLRQSGKIAELSLQFGGSHNALIGMAKNYGITFEVDDAKDIVVKWRRANPWAAEIWAAYDHAIGEAVKTPGVPRKVGRVTYQSDGVNYLWCRLPSGRMLAYPKPKWEQYTTPWGEDRVGPTFQSSTRPPAGEPPMRTHARGALLFQNSVQAVAADVLREALVKADAAGLCIVGHVHDEVIGVGPYEDGERLNAIMLQNPTWAAGLPLATGGVEWGKRYGK